MLIYGKLVYLKMKLIYFFMEKIIDVLVLFMIMVILKSVLIMFFEEVLYEGIYGCGLVLLELLGL